MREQKLRVQIEYDFKCKTFLTTWQSLWEIHTP